MGELLKLDAKGRLSIGTSVRKNGVTPSALWTIGFGTYGTVILTPVSVVAVANQAAA